MPPLAEGEDLPVDKLYGEQHFTQPPPRYTEASLVKALEEYGIGRPSTYASIISTLQDREYVVLDKKRFQPTDVGRLVNCFLTRHFTHYVDYDFTAKLEDKLDDVSNGKRVWTRLMGEFWKDFDGDPGNKQDVDRGCPILRGLPQVRQAAIHAGKQEAASSSAAPAIRNATTRARCMPATDEGRQHPRPGSGQRPRRHAAVRPLRPLRADRRDAGRQESAKPRRASWPKEIPLDQADLELALKFLSLPREVGHHPSHRPADRRQHRPFRPLPLHDGKFKSIPKTDSVYEIDLPRALEVLAMERAPRGADSAASVLKNLGPHPDDGKDITVRSGRYGPYVKHGNINATLPKDITPEDITLEEALDLIAARVAKGPAKKPARKAAAKPTAAKKAKAADTDEPKKPAAKKPAAKKATAKKATTKPAATKKPASKKATAA